MKVNKGNNIIKLDHALHGYQDGHSLIASSIDLNSEIKRTLLVMSDMSGQSMQEGFEEYITGYPVKEMNAYAVAKTWYAPEMKRPGCVWTHTLFIRFSDLIQINENYDLLALFKNPKEVHQEFYSSEIEVKPTSTYVVSLNIKKYDKVFTETLVNALYGENNSSILLRSENAKSYENFIYSLWLQQWPRLKRNFSFCTGSISPRSLTGKPLDIQAVPSNEYLNKDSKEYLVFESTNAKLNSDQNEWCATISNDLYSPSKLRDFLNVYGADVKAKRVSFSSLVKIYNVISRINEKPNLDDLLLLFSQEFPEQDDALNLKALVFNNQQKISSPLWFNEDEVLTELAKTPYHAILNPVKLEIRQRIQRLFDNDPDSVFEILNKALQKEINPIGVEMFSQLAQNIDERNLELIGKKSRKLALMFAVLNPNVAYLDSFWRVSRSEQKENFNMLFQHNLEERIDWNRIIDIILTNDIIVDSEFFEGRNINIAQRILDYYCHSSKTQLSYEWKNWFAYRPMEVLHWLQATNVHTSKGIDLVIKILNPNSLPVIKFGCSVWVNLTKSSDLTHKDLNLRFKSFALALALNNPDKNSLELIVFSVEDVYRALLDNSLDYDSWKRIEKHTKTLPWWSDWDKAKKLTIALVDKFSLFKWPAAYFGRLFKNKKVAEQFLTHYKNYIS